MNNGIENAELVVMAHNPAPRLWYYNQLGKKTFKPAQKTPYSHRFS